MESERKEKCLDKIVTIEELNYQVVDPRLWDFFCFFVFFFLAFREGS